MILLIFLYFTGKLIETEEQQEDGSDGDKGNSSSSKPQKSDGKDSDGPGPPTLTYVKQTPTGDIIFKRNIADSTDTIHLRKTIRLASDENRSMLQIKPEFIKKGDNENQILIPIKLHASDLVKDIQNSLIVNKNNKTFGDKKHGGVHNQNVSSVNCIRQNAGESDSNSFLKTRRINKLDDAVSESSKKFKRNEC